MIVFNKWLHRFVKHPGSTLTDIQYLHRDQLGSVDSITTSAGGLMRNLSFDPYGARRESDWSKDATAATMPQIRNDQDIYGSQGFTDHEHLDRTGIVHMNGCIFDSRIGHFLQPDSIVQSPGFSQSYNRYAYVFNSPLSFTDPSGFAGELCDTGCQQEDTRHGTFSDLPIAGIGPGPGGFFTQYALFNGRGNYSAYRAASVDVFPVAEGGTLVVDADRSIQKNVTEASNLVLLGSATVVVRGGSVVLGGAIGDSMLGRIRVLGGPIAVALLIFTTESVYDSTLVPAQVETFPNVLIIQAQGGRGSSGADIEIAVGSNEPITKVQARSLLRMLQGKLSRRQLKERNRAFIQAEKFIERTAPVVAPEFGISFPKPPTEFGTRVDFEVPVGTAFVDP